MLTGGKNMVRLTLRVSDELHEKLRWLAFRERRSQHSIVVELLENGLAKVNVPKEVRK
jgi:predicted transcriptional regulator